MNKEDIAALLETKHQDLFKYFENSTEEQWVEGPEGKWTRGQHALHLLKSIKAVNDAMSLPKFLLKYRFGKSNRDVRTYDLVANKYQEKLKDNLDRARIFNGKLKAPQIKDKEYIINRLKTENKKLQHKTLKWKDRYLDNLILPHPLMGKMPIREIVMWTAHHVEHHTITLKEKY